MLIVEDHAELNHLIEQQFADDFDTTCAFDGTTGLQSALELIPDLIISDIMMPEMDGFELCRQVKQELTTSHIPIILLTAKTSDGEKIKGLEIGADDYISKPFSVSVLKARVQNLIESRQLLRKQFSKLPNIESIEKLSKLDK
jgi:DNA-binding response OmpR family regulator